MTHNNFFRSSGHLQLPAAKTLHTAIPLFINMVNFKSE